jgi:hypothetical protein
MQAVLRPRRLLIALGAVAASLGLAGTASASVPGIERITAASPTDSGASKSSLASCPAGKRVVGVGGEITGGFGEVAMTQVVPSNDLRHVFVNAQEDAIGSSRSWRVDAYAMCANPIAGAHVVSAIRTNVFDDTTARATCPAGEKIMSVGGRISGSGTGTAGVNGRVGITGFTYPSSSIGDARAQERQTATTGTWSVEALAICGPPLPGQVRGFKFTDSNSDSKERGIGCPPGTNLLGGGGFVAGGLGQVVLDDLRPSPTGFTTFGREDKDGFGGNWSLEASAICA